MSENPQDQDPEVDFEENDIEPQEEVDETDPIDPKFRPVENIPEFSLSALPAGTIPQVLFITRFKLAKTTEKNIRELVEPFGSLKSVHIKPKSVFVEFFNVEDAHKAKHSLHCRPGLGSDSLIVDFKQDNREEKNGRGDRDHSRRSRERRGSFPHSRDRERERDRQRDPRDMTIRDRESHRDNYFHRRDRNWNPRDSRDRFDRQYHPPSPPHRSLLGYDREPYEYSIELSHQQLPPSLHNHSHLSPPSQYRRPDSYDRYDAGGQSMAFSHSSRQYPSHMQSNYCRPPLSHSRMSQDRPPEGHPPYRSNDRYYRSSEPSSPLSSGNSIQYHRQPYPNDRPERSLYSSQQQGHIPAKDDSYAQLHRSNSGYKRSLDQVESHQSHHSLYDPQTTGGRVGPSISAYEHQQQHQHGSHRSAAEVHGKSYSPYTSQQDYKRQKY
jgi:hypothetical protein